MGEWVIENAMKINPRKSKAVSFVRAGVKDSLNYYLGDERMLEVSSCKYLGIIICSDLSWGDQVNYTVQQAMKALHFIMHILKKGNSNMKSLAYMPLVHLVLEYGAACWDPYREGHVNTLDFVQKKAAKFADHTSDLVWETLAQRSKMAHICALFKVYSVKWAWKTTRDRLQGPCYLSPDDHDWKTRSRQQRTYIGKYSFVNRTIKLWNQLPAEVLILFPVDHIFLKRGLGK